MLPRDTLLKGSRRPQELAALIDLAEEALRTWEPRWSGFVDAQLKEEAEARLGALSEVSLLGDGLGLEDCVAVLHHLTRTADAHRPFLQMFSYFVLTLQLLPLLQLVFFSPASMQESGC